MIGASSVKRDIGAQRSLQAQLPQAQKMEAVGRLAGGIAHDFNNLLSVILGYGEMTVAERRDADPLRAYLIEMVQAGGRATACTRSWLVP